MCLLHEGSMIGIQCQLMICRGHIRAFKGVFQTFLYDKTDIEVKFLTFVFISGQI